jgi:hypothetical protein
MSTSSEEFASYAEAERRLCDEAGPVVAAIIRSVEASTGLQIAEVRVTFDRTTRTGELISANCTIARAASSTSSNGYSDAEEGHSPNQHAAD